MLTLFVTLMRGEDGIVSAWNLHLFYAWREAWNQFTLQFWLNILLSIALFVPLGILLPLLFRWAQHWYAMLLCGFGASLGIELLQFVLKRGISDVDDLFNNTLGAMLGWSLIMFILILVRRQPGWGKRCLAYLSILAAFALSMGLLFGIYALKPYGNLPNAAAATYPMKDIQWSIAFEPSEKAETAVVYRAGKPNREEVAAIAEKFSEIHQISFPDTYYYDTTTIFANHSTRDSLHVNLRDGTWEYQIAWEDAVRFDKPIEAVDANDLLPVLREWGIDIPAQAAFTTEGEAPFIQTKFQVHMVEQNGEIVHGSLICRLSSASGDTQLAVVANSLVALKEYQDEEIIPPAAAVEALKSGRSAMSGMLHYIKPTEVEIRSCTLDWTADTKGFYQPVYRLELVLPGEEHCCTDWVPALK